MQCASFQALGVQYLSTEGRSDDPHDCHNIACLSQRYFEYVLGNFSISLLYDIIFSRKSSVRDTAASSSALVLRADSNVQNMAVSTPGAQPTREHSATLLTQQPHHHWPCHTVTAYLTPAQLIPWHSPPVPRQNVQSISPLPQKPGSCAHRTSPLLQRGLRERGEGDRTSQKRQRVAAMCPSQPSFPAWPVGQSVRWRLGGATPCLC